MILVTHSNSRIYPIFSTFKYKCDDSTLGDNFDPYPHLTNFSLHGREDNWKKLLEDKDTLGVGCEWRYNKLVKHFKSKYPGFDESIIDKQLDVIGKDTLLAVTGHDSFKR